MLLKNPNIDIDKCDSNGTTPLFAAITENNYDITALLLKMGADLNRTRVSYNKVARNDRSCHCMHQQFCALQTCRLLQIHSRLDSLKRHPLLMPVHEDFSILLSF